MQRLEVALAASEDESSPEKDAIEGFSIKARRAQAKLRLVEERLKSCEEYLDRSLKKLEGQGRSGENKSKIVEEEAVSGVVGLDVLQATRGPRCSRVLGGLTCGSRIDFPVGRGGAHAHGSGQWERRCHVESKWRPTLHQCGYDGCRVGEASNPVPVQTRSAKLRTFQYKL